MTTEEMIASLKDQAQDKERLAGGDPDSVFTADATVLIEAAKLLRAQQAPAKLDRSRWEECRWCGNKWIVKNQIKEEMEYCPLCGRPLTDEAWAELVRRIGGNDGK